VATVRIDAANGAGHLFELPTSIPESPGLVAPAYRDVKPSHAKGLAAIGRDGRYLTQFCQRRAEPSR